jgi:hypothetical protein
MWHTGEVPWFQLYVKRQPSQCIANIDSAYIFHNDRARKKTMIMPPTLYTIFLRFRSEKLVAFCLCTISSSLGCRHVPVRGVDGDDCATGVEGREEVDMAD